MQAHVTSGAELPALGVDIVRVERIAKVMQRHPARFPARVLTDAEQAYVRARPENFAGRWAAKEAVSKVLGLGIRGIGWREIEIERLPTGQPTVRLHGSAADRAAGRFESRWPGNAGYGPLGRPRSATIVITRIDGGVIGV